MPVDVHRPRPYRRKPRLPRVATAIAVAHLTLGGALAAQSGADQRIVSLGGSVTETIFALGAGDRVVAVDRSSLFPAEARALPQVGYFRTLSAEGVLSLEPDVIFASDGSGPPPVIEQLEASGVEIVWVSDDGTPESVITKIETVARALGVEARGGEVRASLEADLALAARLREAVQERPRALFVWGQSGGGVRVAGAETGAATMLDRAGAINAAADMSGYQPTTAEAILLAAPEVLVVPQSTVDGLGGLGGLWAVPGMSGTPAGAARRVVVVDLLAFIGFGPRVGEALLGVMNDLHPGIRTPVR